MLQVAGPSFSGGSCILGLGLVGARFRIRLEGLVNKGRGRV